MPVDAHHVAAGVQFAEEVRAPSATFPDETSSLAVLTRRCAAPPAAVYYKHVADDDVRFDWDQANAEHIARHSVKPHEAEQVIRNDPLDMNYEVIDGEERWTLGHTDEYRVLLVVRTVRTDALRIVTARAVGRRARDAYFACQRIVEMKKLIVPKFSTEAEEAAWWDNHMDVVEENLVEAIQGGTASRGTAPRVLREARELESVTIQMPRSDVNRAERLSARKGLSSEAHLRSLLHEALQREESGDPTRGES